MRGRRSKPPKGQAVAWLEAMRPSEPFFTFTDEHGNQCEAILKAFSQETADRYRRQVREAYGNAGTVWVGLTAYVYRVVEYANE